MKISEAISEFQLEHIARGSRPYTITFYRRTLNNLLRSTLEEDVTTLNAFAVNKALSTMASRGVKPATLASGDRALRAFTAWLHGVDLIQKDPMRGRKRPKNRWEPKQVLNTAEIQAMFATVKKDPRYRERNTAILYLLLSCGLRAGEAVSLCLPDIDWEQGILKVRGKTGFGIVPVDKRTLQVIRRYVTHSRKAQPQVTQLFVHNGRPIAAGGLSHLIGRIAKRAEIERPVSPHLLRHTFATNFIESGGDGFSLKRILRHTTMFTTNLYVHNSTASIRNKMEESSLLRNVKL